MTPARRLGILGGTFDPIHRGHVDLGRAAEAALGLAEVLLLPARVPPHRPPPIASAFHRFAMTALAALDYPLWRVSDRELARSEPSFTSVTLASFHADGHAPSHLYFIVGADAFAEIESWRDYPALLDAAHFAVVSRPGHPVADIPARLPALAPRMIPLRSGIPADGRPRIILIDRATANVSATAIRTRCAAGQPVGDLVPPAVAQHMVRHGLYARPTAADDSPHQRHDESAGRLHGQD